VPSAANSHVIWPRSLWRATSRGTKRKRLSTTWHSGTLHCCGTFRYTAAIFHSSRISCEKHLFLLLYYHHADHRSGMHAATVVSGVHCAFTSRRNQATAAIHSQQHSSRSTNGRRTTATTAARVTDLPSPLFSPHLSTSQQSWRSPRSMRRARLDWTTIWSLPKNNACSQDGP